MDFTSFDKSDVSLLNDIVYLIYSVEDVDEMRIKFLELLKYLIPFEHASFYLNSNEDFDKHQLSRPVGFNISEEYLQAYLDYYEEEDYLIWIFKGAKSMAYRETDLVSDEKRENTRYYKEVYKLANFHYSAQVSLAHRETFMGVISLYRPKDDVEFSDTEIFYLDLLKEHLAYRLYISTSRYTLPGMYNLDVTPLAEKYSLTEREAEVLNLMYAGLSDNMITEMLSISPHTLKKHRLNLYKKIGVNSRWELYTKLK